MDIANTRYMVSFGHNLYEGIGVAETHELMTAREKGAKWSASIPICGFSPTRRMNGAQAGRRLAGVNGHVTS